MINKLSVGVALLPQLLPADWAELPTIAIVIDTLRFTSTACVALQAGTQCVRVISDIEQARLLAATTQPAMLLCGERHCVKIPGFDLGNSPLEYLESTVNQRELIFSTTNGTVAVEAVQAAEQIALGSLLNRSALTKWLSEHPIQRAWIVCAGTDGQVAQEDVLTAGALLDGLHKLAKVDHLNDSASLSLNAWRQVQLENRLLDELRAAKGGRNLIENGFTQDVEFAARIDQSNCVPLTTRGLEPKRQFCRCPSVL